MRFSVAAQRLPGLLFNRGFIEKHDRDVVTDRIHTLARVTFERGVILDQLDGSLAARTRKDLEQFWIDGHRRQIV